MSRDPPADEGSPADDEVAFWHGFIEWWETKEGRPATPRMREALAYAEAKRTSDLRSASGNKLALPTDHSARRH